jgi:hypothetical protein
MTFTYTPELKQYMLRKNKPNIVVEVVHINHSDIELTELHIYAVTNRRAKFMEKEKKYRSVQTEMGLVLLPPYHLEYEEEVRFELKRIYRFFDIIIYHGIRL